MVATLVHLAALAPREEGWLWWMGLVLGVAAAALIVLAVRRRFVTPMPHVPSDTTDAWKEAGRRLQVPKGGGKDAAEDEESP